MDPSAAKPPTAGRVVMQLLCSPTRSGPPTGNKQAQAEHQQASSPGQLSCPQCQGPVGQSMQAGQPGSQQGNQLLRLVHQLKHGLVGSTCAAMISVAPGRAALFWAVLSLLQAEQVSASRLALDAPAFCWCLWRGFACYSRPGSGTSRTSADASPLLQRCHVAAAGV